jgi:hypothetical protein
MAKSVDFHGFGLNDINGLAGLDGHILLVVSVLIFVISQPISFHFG